MSDTKSDGSEQEWPSCPYCRQRAGDEYETGHGDFRELQCNNTNCRCQVFRYEDTGNER